MRTTTTERQPRLSILALCSMIGTLALAWSLTVTGNPITALPDTIESVRPSVVGIGTYQRTRTPSVHLEATGFVIADGRHVVTNAHAIPQSVDNDRGERLSVFVGSGRDGEARRAETVAVDESVDLAILRFDGAPLPALTLGDSEAVREGQLLAFTGYPIGMVLGLYPATHRGIVAAITPLAAPAARSGDLDPATLRQLRNQPPGVFQLDATAYPGNSGSPLYEPDSGNVVGVINRVFVQQSRERVISEPSGITYAVPVGLLDTLLEEAGLK